MMTDHHQKFSRGLESTDTKFQLSQQSRNYVPRTLYLEIITDPIRADVVSRQFKFKCKIFKIQNSLLP